MLLAIEGCDGGGKGTQAKILVERIGRESKQRTGRCHGANLLSFPDYDNTVFGPHIKRFLRGEFGPLDQNDPFLVSLLYALDRFENRIKLDTYAESENHILVCDRYVPSNIAHQGAQLFKPDAEELVRSIEVVEYDVLGLPRPDLVILMDITPEQSQSRTQGRNDAPDILQDNLEHMARARDIYLKLAERYPEWKIVKCFDPWDLPRSVEAIADQVWEIVCEACPDGFLGS